MNEELNNAIIENYGELKLFAAQVGESVKFIQAVIDGKERLSVANEFEWAGILGVRPYEIGLDGPVREQDR